MKLLSLITLIAVLLSCSEKKPDGYLLSGEIAGFDDGKMVLSYFDYANMKAVKIDSVQIFKGRFELKNKLDYPMNVRAIVTPGNYQFSFWLENSKIVIKSDLINAEEEKWGVANLPVQITGSSIQQEYDKYMALLKPINDEMKPIAKVYDVANMAYIKGAKERLPEEDLEILKDKAQAAYDAMKPFSQQRIAIGTNYMNEQKSSYVTATLLFSHKTFMTLEELKERYEFLSNDIKKVLLVRCLKQRSKKV